LPFAPSPLRLNIFHLFWSFRWPNYIATLPRYFSFRLPHLNISTGHPSDELDQNIQRKWLGENLSHWNGYNHFRFVLDFSYMTPHCLSGIFTFYFISYTLYIKIGIGHYTIVCQEYLHLILFLIYNELGSVTTLLSVRNIYILFYFLNLTDNSVVSDPNSLYLRNTIKCKYSRQKIV
jgi:hypothetical protein